MSTLKSIFRLPFTILLVIMSLITVYIRHKRYGDVTFYNYPQIISDIGKAIVEKYHKHATPFSAVFWIFIYVLIR